MKFSNRCITLSKNPKHIRTNEKDLFDHELVTKLNQLKIEIKILFNTFQDSELLVSKAKYITSYEGEYIGVIDGFFHLIQGKPLEAIDRFPIKELDYFLRDKQSESAFSAYSQELYEIVALGEKMKSMVLGAKGQIFSFNENLGPLESRSLSEQFEVIEEFLSFFYYREGYSLESIECIDITDDELIFNISKELDIDIEKKLNLNIKTNLKVVLNLF
jgi:hypothetical protein